MYTDNDYSFHRYLESKRTVDDRALNTHVWQACVQGVTAKEAPLRVLEVGAGIGTMVERVIEWGLFPGNIHYLAIDADAHSLEYAHWRLSEWATANRWKVTSGKDSLILSQSDRAVVLTFDASDIADFISRHKEQRGWDILIAHAVLDLFNVPAILPGLLSLMGQDGWFYFTLNFDGITAFQPILDPVFDGRIETLYHRTMDERMVDGLPSGDSHTGRHLLTYLHDAGAKIVTAGSSDWVVFPQAGKYLVDESYFLHFILHTIQDALRNHPEIDTVQLENWIKTRHAQVERGELIYIAHQLDVAGQVHRPH